MEITHEYVAPKSPEEKEKSLKKLKFGILKIFFVLASIVIILEALNATGIIHLPGPLTPKGFIPFINNLFHDTSFAFSINGDKISWDYYNKTTDFIQKNGKFDAKTAQKTAYKGIIELWLLEKEADKRGIKYETPIIKKENPSFADFIEKDPQFERSLEGLFLKTRLTPFLVRQISGNYILITFGFDRPEFKGINQKVLALKKITDVNERMTNGESFDSAGLKINNDPDVKILNGANLPGNQSTPNGLAYLSFANLQTTDQFFSNEFMKAVFSLKKAGDQTGIILLKNDPTTFGRSSSQNEFGYILIQLKAVSLGTYSSYNEWLNEAIKKLKIVSNLKFIL